MVDLKFQNVSKRYFFRGGAPRRPTSYSLRWWPKAELWALQDVNFEVERGEAVGIVGHNGAGKSTILKLLSSITAPTRGEITIRGRLSALVEVGSGFHPELTGRENIYLNGSILGMRRSEITAKVESIIEFAGVRDHIDIAVKKYSSGMYLRLGFSIAAHLDPDILLLDEVLAVGDIAFQEKCLNRISELRAAGRTIVFITHDLAALARLCDRAMLLDSGRLMMTGSPRKVIDEYLTMGFADADSSTTTADSSAEKLAECRGVSFIPGDSGETVRTGYPMIARLKYFASRDLAKVGFKISVYWPSGYLCSELTTPALSQINLRQGLGVVEFRCPVLPFQPGLYRVDVSLESNDYIIDKRLRCATLRVDPGKVVLGDFYFDHTWKIIEE